MGSTPAGIAFALFALLNSADVGSGILGVLTLCKFREA
ncbi:MAG: hypothetical protein AVDCRST_MAG93-8079 [uncultured Chloroflexia bacterium]|uniref:Uncharacterized protein n=1 Tax=uncultured Chloroflexia bacterium TaxID=1672391 RepID=A0A6J4MS19_9CHLR|nr:MAG: hypothetical protein AVDCRST_MAG93-8079 [uncultured Chloroflexia bacterium]